MLLHDLEELNNHFRHGANQNLALSALFGVVHGLQEERRPRISKKTLKNTSSRIARSGARSISEDSTG